MLLSILSVLLLIAAVPAGEGPAAAAPIAEVKWTFDEGSDPNGFAVTVTGEAEKRDSPPKIADGRLYLLPSWWKSTAAVAFAAPTETLARIVDVRWTMIMNTGTEGAGFAWLNVAEYAGRGAAPEVAAWEAPDVAGSFAVGFDASNPPNRDPFRGSGNAYDRPQHEVSLHWDGREILKRTTPMDFRDEQPHAVRVRVTFVTGGADVSIWIDDQPIYEDYFVPGMTAYVGRPAFGARNTETAGDILIDEVHVTCHQPIAAPEPPLTITAIDRALNDKDHPRNEAEVEFPTDTSEFGRIICTLRLDKPETRFDPWDRIAHIWIHDEDGTRYELLRYITPYHRGHVWQVDVTDWRPLLTGKRRIEQVCTTYGEGWVVSVTFDFYPGEPERVAYRVVNLWSGNPEVGNPGKPTSDFYVPREVATDDATVAAKVRLVVTGHGMSPNTDNAGEFMPLGRTLSVNGREFRNVLWKTDNYLNPCRPQGGTWKYDRAGWAPGDVVRPWEVDVTELLEPGEPLRIEYALDEYVNENRGQTWAPTHTTEAQVILYRAADSSEP